MLGGNGAQDFYSQNDYHGSNHRGGTNLNNSFNNAAQSNKGKGYDNFNGRGANGVNHSNAVRGKHPPGLTASNVHFAGNFDFQEDDNLFFEGESEPHHSGSHHNKHGYGNRGRPYSHRYDDAGYGGHHSNHQHVDRHYEGGRGSNRDEVMNFSLHYRHLLENNPEKLNVLLVLNLRVGERKHVRVLVYELDNIRELGNRLVSYLMMHGAVYLPENYTGVLVQSLIYLIESKLHDIGLPNPQFPNAVPASDDSSNTAGGTKLAEPETPTSTAKPNASKLTASTSETTQSSQSTGP